LKKVILLTLPAMLLAGICFADTGSNASILYPFMDIEPCARAAALADAVCGLGEDADVGSIFENPSLLAAIDRTQVSMTYGKWFVDSSYQDLAAAFKTGFGNIGGELLYMDHGTFEKRDSFGGLLSGTLRSYDIAFSGEYGLKLTPQFSTGLALKVMEQTTAYQSKAGAGLDAGMLYKFEKVFVGVALNNIGADPQFGYPFTMRAGAGSRFEIAKGHGVLMGFDAKYILHDELTFSAGAEYDYMQTVFARAGYRMRTGSSSYDAISGVTMGAGLKLAGFNFDYALVPFGDLGLTNRVTVSYSFTAMQAAEKPASKPFKPVLPSSTP